MPKASRRSTTQRCKVTLDLDVGTVEGVKDWHRTAYAPGWMLHKILQAILDELPDRGEIVSDEALKSRNLVSAYLELAERSTLQDVVRDTGLPELSAKRALEELVRANHLKRDSHFYWFRSPIARAE
jgi:hypothetical protein